MTRDEIKGKDLAIKLLSGYVQKDIKEARVIADFWYMILTGLGHDGIIKKYRQKETKKQQEQAVLFYDPRTKYVSQKVKSVFKKADRTDGIIDVIKYKGELNDTSLIEIKRAISDFYGGRNLDRWLNKRYRNDVFIDPNTVYLLKFKDFNNNIEKPTVYPARYGSHDQVERIYKSGVLDNVTFIESIKSPSKEDPYKKTNRLVYYEANKAVTCYILHDEDLLKPADYDSEVKTGYYINVDFENKTYTAYVEESLTKSKQLPAWCVGYVDCDESKSDYVYESPMYPSKDVLIELIKRKSKYDVHLALHGIMQKMAYVPRCSYIEQNTGVRCNGGTLTNGKTCKSCDGTGKVKFHQTEQDIVTMQLPDDTSNMLDLSKLLHYQKVDTELIRLYKDEVEELQKTVSLAIFNTNMFDRKELSAATATEIRANLTYVNNESYDYKQHQADIWTGIVTQIAIYLENDEGLIVSRKIPTDYKFETLGDLFAFRKAAIDAGAPYDIIKKIDKLIIEKQNADDPDNVKKITARDNWKPFNDKSESERISIITLLPDDHNQKILYYNFQEIFNEIENAKGFDFEDITTSLPFYSLPYAQQKIIVNSYIDNYKTEAIQTPNVRNETE